MNGGPAVRGPLLQGVAPRRAAMTLALAIAALGWVYSQILYHMVLHWRHVPDYNHGFLVAPLAAWFAWERRADLRRAARPGLKLGICGEHGGDPRSIRFCHAVGLDYVSCSPFRVPIARLAAARAALDGPPPGDA